MKAIVADDDEVVLRGLNTVIPWSSLGYDTVLSARNGEEAYRTALRENPDVILTDIRMPVMDGLELARMVHENMGHVAVLIMSAYEDFQYAKSAIRYGVADYILKPIDLDKIRELILRLTRIREQEDARRNMIRSLYGGELEERVTRDLKNEDLEDISLFLNLEIHRLASSAPERKELCLKLADILFTYYETIGVCLNPVCKPKTEVISAIAGSNSYEEIKAWILELAQNVFRYLDMEKTNHENALAAAARRIIDREYSNSSLSLQYVADKTGVTPARLSVLFRQAFGINFSSYLGRLRIEKSQKLLKDFSLKIEDIGNMVGYSDSHYFAKVFKRSVNLTPSEYRNISGGSPYVV